MLWDGPYKERMVGFYLQRVGRLYGVGLRFAFEAFMPAFEVVQAETFHKEFSYPFFGNGFQPIIFTYGGGAVGLDVMEFFTERGAEVTMVEMLPMIGNGLDPVTKCDTNAKMAKYGVKQMTNTALQEVKNDRFIVKNPEGEIEEIPFDYGFICLGTVSYTHLTLPTICSV